MSSKLRSARVVAAMFGFLALGSTVSSNACETAPKSCSDAGRPRTGGACHNGTTGTRLSADTGNACQDGRLLLERMLFSECQTAYVARQSTTLQRARGTVTSEQIVSWDHDRAIKIAYVSGPPTVAGEQIVDDGTAFWHYIPTRNTLAIGPSRMERQRKRIQQLIKQIKRGTLSVQITGQETVAGRVCDIVDVRPVSGFGPWRRFWLDRASHLQLKGEEYRIDSTLQSKSEFTQIDLIDNFSPGTFVAPATPANVSRVPADVPHPTTIKDAQERLDFPIRQPVELPPGYVFQSAQVTQFRENKMVVLRYANGLNTLSVYETPAAPSDPPQAVTAPRPDVALATIGGMKLVVVGNEGMDVLERVLSSLH